MTLVVSSAEEKDTQKVRSSSFQSRDPTVQYSFRTVSRFDRVSFLS